MAQVSLLRLAAAGELALGPVGLLALRGIRRTTPCLYLRFEAALDAGEGYARFCLLDRSLVTEYTDTRRVSIFGLGGSTSVLFDPYAGVEAFQLR